MTNPKRIYWDACAWLAFIKQETIEVDGKKENRHQMCKQILLAAEKGLLEIATSALTLSEVCKSPELKESPVDNLPAFFDKSYILLVTVDKAIGLKAQAMQLAGMSGLKPVDAIHLASALASNSTELHTFDTKLLNKSKHVAGKDGKPLIICKPGDNDATGTLLEMTQASFHEE